ncbi:UvrD-helicase domain-containing protein [Streptosporangium lutulentum]
MPLSKRWPSTGKTSTLRLVAHALAESAPTKKIIYFAYNRSIADEAQAAFPDNVTANTSHSFARAGLADGRYKNKINQVGQGVRLPADQAAILGIPKQFIADDEYVSGAVAARLAMATVRKYRESGDDDLTGQHLPQAVSDTPELATAVLGYARAAWADITDPAGKLLFDHDDYLKIWALSKPRLLCDMIFFDEAQDINGVLRRLVQDQPTQTIVVGDSNQSIYSFRGAIDALRGWPANVTLPLTQSWRFGSVPAAVGNRFLTMLGSPLLLEGNPRLNTRLAPVEAPDAVLCRTNAGAIGEVFDALQSGKRVAMVGGGQALKDIARAARDLQGRRTRHPELADFPDWDAVRDHIRDDPDAQSLEVFVTLVERYGAEQLIRMLDQLVPEDDPDPDEGPQVVVSTVHKAKGREWDHVKIANDFRGPTYDEKTKEIIPPSDEALRLAYVTVTRARKTLQLGSLGWICDDDVVAEVMAALPSHCVTGPSRSFPTPTARLPPRRRRIN